MEFPGKDRIQKPIINLRYQIDIQAKPEQIWPWIIQVGYHRAGWYIDTWWDKFEQQYFWPMIVPKNARGTYKPPTDNILQEYQDIKLGDIIPDGPPGSAYYEIVGLEEYSLLLLYATTHFNYMAPPFVYKTRLAPRGAFCWAFMLKQINEHKTRLVSWWQAEGNPELGFLLFKPFLILVDSAHQKQILKGIKKRVEKESPTSSAEGHPEIWSDDHEFFRSMVKNGQIRPSARAIIVNSARDRILVEKSHGAREQYTNFIGGGVELGESLEECVRREIAEETDAEILRIEYLFVLENFITFKGDLTHGLEHYFEVELDRDDVHSNIPSELIWYTIGELGKIDLRPSIVRDRIEDGSYRSVRHLSSRDKIT